MVELGIDRWSEQAVHLNDRARRQGLYVIGTTGTGKTTLLHNLIYQDITDPNKPGVCVIDPHGDLIDGIIECLPEERLGDVVLFAPGEREQLAQPLGLNLLACNRDDPIEVRLVAETVVDTLKRLFWYSWGPRMEDLLRHATRTLIEQEEATLLELLLILASPRHRQVYVEEVKDPVLKHFWEVQFAAHEQSARLLVEVVGSSLNKIGRFLVDPLMRNVVCQKKNAFELSEVLDKGKILLVSLSKGQLGEENARLLGAVLVNLILIAALRRREQAEDQRRLFHLVVDEFQNFATDSFAVLQSEARKYAVTVTVAHQYRAQLDELNLGSTLNVANMVVMRVTGRDAEELAYQFDNTPPEPEVKMEPLYKEISRDSFNGEQVFIASRHSGGAGIRYHEVKQPQRLYTDVASEKANQLSIQMDYQAHCRLIEGRQLKEYVVDTYPPMGEARSGNAEWVRRQSVQAGQVREDVEADIKQRIGGEIDFSQFSFIQEL